MATKLKITFPFDFVKGLNDLLRLPDVPGSRGKIIGIRKSIKKRINDYIYDLHLPKVTPQNVVLVLEYNTSPKDVDNIASGAKFVLDGLKPREKGDTNYTIEDDNKFWVHTIVATAVKVDHKEDRKYELYFLDSLNDANDIINSLNDLA